MQYICQLHSAPCQNCGRAQPSSHSWLRQTAASWGTQNSTVPGQRKLSSCVSALNSARSSTQQSQATLSSALTSQHPPQPCGLGSTLGRKPNVQQSAVSVGGPLLELAVGLTGDSMQDVLLGGAIVSAVGAALVAGAKGEPEICEGCAGNGGVKCFACDGTGRMELQNRAELGDARKRDIVGRPKNPNQCTVCKGPGLILCGRCQGSGYQKRM